MVQQPQLLLLLLLLLLFAQNLSPRLDVLIPLYRELQQQLVGSSS
jgi:hypothetical protein